MITEQSIRNALATTSKDLLEFILNGNAQKTFAITVLAISDPKHRSEAMNAFRRHNFTDDCLTINKLPAQGTCMVQSRLKCSKACRLKKARNCTHDPRLDAFHHFPWGDTNSNTFYEKQWCFFLQAFKRDKFEYVVEDKRILPFTKKHVQVKKGGNFSDVVQASILANHQDTLEQVNWPEN